MERWFEVKFHISRDTVGIDRDWTSHIDRVVLDFSGYRHEFDCSTMYEEHPVHEPNGTPEVSVQNEIMMHTDEGIFVCWERGKTESAQVSKDLLEWKQLSHGEAIELLNKNGIKQAKAGLCQAVSTWCDKTRHVTPDDLIGKVAKPFALFEQCLLEHTPDWFIVEVAPGFREVYYHEKIAFTISPLHIVFWSDTDTPNPMSESEAIAQVRGAR